ncbi:intraflagellar transport protein 56 [Trichonephila inaurata madagascariensis]|uniref:Intraflagellar transport protein 56 n=1 Tax=Trichonephila inaurata madagascariensis TaxID=2747483 RepID=A0A8X7BRA9_9ARAC|nr:intraflagellar transport protein 56 [Trichonephila inaurata madagascariensis]
MTDPTAIFLQHYPDSTTAINLKACNHFCLYNGKAAEAELKSLQDMSSPSFTYGKDLICHNLSYFYNADTFNFNSAQAKAATGDFKEVEE